MRQLNEGCVNPKDPNRFGVNQVVEVNFATQHFVGDDDVSALVVVDDGDEKAAPASNDGQG